MYEGRTAAVDHLANWQIKGGNGAYIFAIDRDTGAITIPDRSKLNGNSSFTLTLMASDGILPAHDATVTITPQVVTGTVQLITNITLTKQGDGSWTAAVTVNNTRHGDGGERGADRSRCWQCERHAPRRYR